MRRPRPQPLYLERDSYRRRRVMDAGRLLPVLGLGLVLLPALWPQGAVPDTGREAVYLFIIWAGLILVARGLSGPLQRALGEGVAPKPRGLRPPEADARDPKGDGSDG